jgi:hypothetical protein
MSENSWRTLCWAIGLEDPARAFLKAQLLMIAVELKERGNWPEAFKRGNCSTELRPGVRCGAVRCRHGGYLEDLCELALIEIAEPFVFNADTRRAQFFGVAVHTWERHLKKLYAELAERPKIWFKGAIGHINRRLHEREIQVGAA